MKKIFILIVIIISTTLTFSQEKNISKVSDQKKSFQPIQTQSTLTTSFLLDINKLKLPIDNRGTLGDVNIPGFGSYGRYDEAVFLFSGGFHITGKVNDTLWAAGLLTASRIADYQAGRVNTPTGDSLNIIYVVKKSDLDFGTSWQQWRNAVTQGAEFYDGDNDGIYNPIDRNSNGRWDINEDKPNLIGDITTFSVFNDGIAAAQRRFAGMKPVGLEVRQSIFGWTSTPGKWLENVLFVRYQISNTGLANDLIDSVIFSVATDPDIGDYTDDLSGTDTLLNLVYTWANQNDAQFGVRVPSFATMLLQGPHAFIPNVTYRDNNSNGRFDIGDTPLDTAINRRGELLGVQRIIGAKNLRMTSSRIGYSSHPTLGDPDNARELRNIQIGRHRSGEIGSACIDNWGLVLGGVNCGQVNPGFHYSGDPVNRMGWIGNVPGDIRMYATSGSFQLRRGEPVTIIVPYIVARGSSALNSIEMMRHYAQSSRLLYNSNFSNLFAGIKQPDENIIEGFKLYENYPNPFNPSTKISYQLPVASHVTLKVYDVLGNEIASLVDEYKSEGKYEIEFNASNLASGIYFYQLKTDQSNVGQARNFTETKKMILMR